MTTAAECDCSTWALDDFRLGYPNGHHPRCPKRPPAPHAACGKTVTGGQLGVDHCRASYRGHTCNRVVHRDMHYCSCRYSWPMAVDAAVYSGQLAASYCDALSKVSEVDRRRLRFGEWTEDVGGAS